MKKIQFVLMSSFVLGACQLAVINGSADELNATEAILLRMVKQVM